MISGTLMAASQGFTPVFPLALGGVTIPGYSALWSVILNFVVAIVGTWVLNAMHISAGSDETAHSDYTALSAPEPTEAEKSLAAA
jgi:SSS family solute:Na+ symporter